MYAVIHLVPDAPGAGLLPIAGRPLIVRQLQWLRAVGVRDIAVELRAGPEGDEIARWLGERDAIGQGVLLLRTDRALTARALADRAGFPDGAALLAHPADVLCGGPLDAVCAEERGAQAISPTRLVDPPGGGIQLLSSGGWIARARSLADALELGAAALDGRLSRRPSDPCWGIQVHAAEIEPGVWVGRGARVEAGARLRAPVLVGPGAVVRAGAQVGPRVCVGERAVVEAGAVLVDALVMPETIVGEGVEVAGALAEPAAIVHLGSGLRSPIDDRLVLARRGHRSPAALASRAVAVTLLALLAPVAALLQGALPRLLGMLLGTRVIVGLDAGETTPVGGGQTTFSGDDAA
ncbi:MAG: hypothetical protein U0359_12205 [Byssovorax sp.]